MLQALQKLKDDLTLKGEEGKTVADLLLLPLLEAQFSTNAAWFNDIIINNYFNWLASTFSTPDRKIETILSLELSSNISDFCTKLERKKRTAEKLRLQEAQVILCPVNFAETKHWYLLIIEKKPNNVFFVTTLDGFNQQQVHQVLWEKAETVIQFLHPFALQEQGLIAKTSHFIQPQQNTYDCGAVVCYFAKAFCEKQILNKEKPDLGAYTLFRQEIAKALASQEREVFFNFGKKLEMAKKEQNPLSANDPSIKPNLSF